MYDLFKSMYANALYQVHLAYIKEVIRQLSRLYTKLNTRAHLDELNERAMAQADE